MCHYIFVHQSSAFTANIIWVFCIQNTYKFHRMKNFLLLLFTSLLLFSTSQSFAQKKQSMASAIEPIDSRLFDSLEFRSIGPAFMSGRIADLAIDPTNENIWYVAVGSGGVWKTIQCGNHL
jgi:hypothetical protein